MVITIMILSVPANYYQQFDGDQSKPYPAESYGGWKKASLPFDTSSTAFVSMHAWYTGEDGQYPGWKRCVDYIPRASKICRELTGPFLDRVRKSGMTLIHVASWDQPLGNYPGYKKVCEMFGNEPDTLYKDCFPADETVRGYYSFRSENSFVGKNNIADVSAGRKTKDFDRNVYPRDDEYVVSTSKQMIALCKKLGIHHLVYTGFAINMCLLSSPGGMIDMSRYGIFCSSIRQLTSAVENRETARGEKNKEYGLWYDALLYGFVYDLSDIDDYVLKALIEKQ